MRGDTEERKNEAGLHPLNTGGGVMVPDIKDQVRNVQDKICAGLRGHAVDRFFNNFVNLIKNGRNFTPDELGSGDMERSRCGSILWHDGTYGPPVEGFGI